MSRRFAIMDVFADQLFAGNQLGVVFDCEGLDTEAMQKIAREFNFSETVFLSAPELPVHAANMRIFTPRSELPFAGHPTVGGAIAVALDKGLDSVGQGIVILKENVGPVRCAVRFADDNAYAEFDLPLIASFQDGPSDKIAIAAALSLEPHDIGFENHVVTNFDGGLPYTLVPVRDLEAAARAEPNLACWNDGFGRFDHNSAYVYCRETVGHDNHFHARMFAPDAGIPEDPATGSAVASFSGAIVKFDDLPDGLHSFRVEQGVEMDRPSIITLEIDMEQGAMASGRIGGNAVVVARGTLEL